MITQIRLKELLDYSPVSGEFRWRTDRTGKAKEGMLAGRLDSTGYRQISVDNRRYGAHRLAWLCVHGVMPEHEIDHLNGQRDDNRISNLRSVERTTNMRNKRRYRNSKCPYPGVQNYGSWRAVIGNRHIGSFKDFASALAARKAEESRLGYHSNHGRP